MECIKLVVKRSLRRTNSEDKNGIYIIIIASVLVLHVLFVGFIVIAYH
jgi:hypothetical protein